MDRSRAQVTLVLAVAALALAGNALRAGEPGPSPALRLSAMQVEAAGASVAEEALERDFLDALGAREVFYRTYAPDSDTPVWVFAAHFDRQKEGSQVHSPRHCYPGSGWSIEAEPAWPSPWGGGEVHSLVVNDGVERRLVVYWFQLPARVVADVLPLKFALARQAMARSPQDVVFVSVSTPVSTDPAGAMERMVPAVRGVHAGIERLYREREATR